MTHAIKTPVRTTAPRTYNRTVIDNKPKPLTLSHAAIVSEAIRVAGYAFEKMLASSPDAAIVEVAQTHMAMVAELRTVAQRWACPGDARLSQRRTLTATRVFNLMLSCTPGEGQRTDASFIASYSLDHEEMVADLGTFADRWFAPVRNKRSDHYLSPSNTRVFHAAWDREPSERTTTR